MSKIQWYATTVLKDEREKRGFTQREMADLLSLEFGKSVSESLYQQWERGTQNLSPEQVLALSRYLKLDYKQLVEQKTDAGKIKGVGQPG